MYQLTEDDWEWGTRTVDNLGPLTERQRDVLGRLLRKLHEGDSPGISGRCWLEQALHGTGWRRSAV
jgi:hypothetical protein